MTSKPMASRRTILKAGVLGGGLSLAKVLNLSALNSNVNDDGKSAIFICLKGGPSHQDTFDLKPEAPAEYRGEFRPIKTNAQGMEICEHLPKIAKLAKHFSIVRGISHNLADHGIGMRYVVTGNRPIPTIKYPAFGSVASYALDSPNDIPSHVSIDEELEGPGFLGIKHGALATGEKPRANRPFNVRGVTLDEGISIDRFSRRRRLADDVDHLFDQYEKLGDEIQGLDRFSREAHEIIGSKRTRNAFDLTKEKQSTIERFGKGETGQSMLLACRLIEAGVRFVTVIIDGWDTHKDNFRQLKTTLLPEFDASYSAMLERMNDNGLLDSTAILATGEFGRTPKVNGGKGRDHWARASAALLAGATVQGGQVAGSSDDKAAEPKDQGFSPDDLAATFYHKMGIDPHQEFKTASGRPVTFVRNGKIIKGL